MNNSLKNNISISLIQFSPFWKNKQKNFSYLDNLLKDIKTDLIILPEMFNSGFCMDTDKISEKVNGETTDWLKLKSKKLNTTIIGGYAIKEEENVYNRMMVFQNGKFIDKYDKRHLFSYSKEDKYFTKGNERKIITLYGWKFLLTICYDLRFPVWNKNQKDYDIMLNIASFPKKRIDVWDTLLKARAIENQSYTIGCNRTGIDGNKIEYNGHSQIHHPSGEKINPKIIRNDILTFKLSFSDLTLFRDKFPFLKDSDKFQFE